jgi:hypothetical protein
MCVMLLPAADKATLRRVFDTLGAAPGCRGVAALRTLYKV